jgi:hypothetical protein
MGKITPEGIGEVQEAVRRCGRGNAAPRGAERRLNRSDRHLRLRRGSLAAAGGQGAALGAPRSLHDGAVRRRKQAHTRALAVTAAVACHRWLPLKGHVGIITSFNFPVRRPLRAPHADRASPRLRCTSGTPQSAWYVQSHHQGAAADARRAAQVCGNTQVWKGSESVGLTAIACQKIVADVFEKVCTGGSHEERSSPAWRAEPPAARHRVARPGPRPRGRRGAHPRSQDGAGLLHRQARHRSPCALALTNVRLALRSTHVGRHVSSVVHGRFGKTILELGCVLPHPGLHALLSLLPVLAATTPWWSWMMPTCSCACVPPSSQLSAPAVRPGARVCSVQRGADNRAPSRAALHQPASRVRARECA